ncbi:MAG: alkaline phosphatase [Pirellulaceae bacterium]
MRKLQFEAIETGHADWGHWGARPEKYSDWTNHSNRLIPVYVFGGDLKQFSNQNSCYRTAEGLKQVYGYEPTETLNPDANYLDQTDIYRLQLNAQASGKKNIILMVFDGMDWQTTQAAAIYRNKSVKYRLGRGTGLAFQDYQGAPTDFGYYVTSAICGSTQIDVDHQLVVQHETRTGGGYSVQRAGNSPWSIAGDRDYLMGISNGLKQVVTDSAASATSLCSGIKTYNAAINVDMDGKPVESIGRKFQQMGIKVGVVTSVPISHATPACAYANNVSRDDYQDLSRDLLGLTSIYEREQPLAGVDVLIGCGGVDKDNDFENQGKIMFLEIVIYQRTKCNRWQLRMVGDM